MNLTKRTLAVIALAGAAVMSASTVAAADARDATPQRTQYLVYPYAGAYPPGVIPLAVAAPTSALLGINPFGVL
ncbi:hypothetical protein J7F01_22560 [Streptomyces sp. ISL-22]|uniref:hypothetical protein n=1 Tax=Streptomyces TaxID=1883 RepID=UPI00131B0DF3|nr:MULTISPECIES: hypothetical protein [Streptomyces]MBT2420634.1 hypothetical protein [Streptomyces sp. ISL-24]MBT2434901.1 hypothetical protein [Streptomyces sp. ISL-22]